MADMVETTVHRDPWDVNARLAELNLDRDGLLKVVALSRLARNNATDLHPANSAGTFSYHEGVAGLRETFLGTEWVLDRSDGIEAIVNLKTGVKVSFANVDEACGINPPKPRSQKGAGAERASGLLFSVLPNYAPRSTGGGVLFYLMVDQRGAAELSRPIIKNGTFTAAVERIFLKSADDETDIDVVGGGGDIAGGFDPQIVRK